MSDSNPMGDDPELTDMLRRLRFERDQELAELEDEADRLEAKQSDLPRVAMKAMMAGELWSVSFGERTFDGHAVHVGDDFVGLSDAGGNLLDIAYVAIDFIKVARQNGAPGHAPVTLRPATLRGRLLALQETRLVEIGGGHWSLTGRIETANSDHIELRPSADAHVIIPMDSIGYVVRRPPEHRRDAIVR